MTTLDRGLVRRRFDHGGFTLTELLVAMTCLGLVLAGLTGMFVSGQQSFLVGANQVEAQENVRIALQRMSDEIRGAGNGPSGAAFTAIAAGQTATSLVLQNDWNGNGIIEPAVTTNVNGAPRGEQVTYSYVGTQLMRQESGVDAAAVPLVGGIQSLTFTYLGADGATTAVTDNIRSVTVAVRGGPQTRAPTNPCAPYTYAEGNVGVAMIDTARIRNR